MPNSWIGSPRSPLAAKLSHNNIVQAIDVGTAGVVHYFVMELVQGRTIKQELEGGKLYKEKVAVEIILQVAQALQHANKRGLIHRDIKPANIVFTEDGIAKLADLGLARETKDTGLARQEKGMTIGTPFYIAPEQILGKEHIDIRADIYSLGATLYHMVTGKPPFPDRPVSEMLQSHLDEPLVPPDHINRELSGGLGEVVEFMTAKEPAGRYRTPDDLIIDLECLLNGESPKLAHQRIEASSLRDLAEGEADDDVLLRRKVGPSWAWVGIMLGLLVFSILLNVVLLIVSRHHG